MTTDPSPAPGVAPVLVIGVGSPVRGDDGVGPIVAARVAERLGEAAGIDAGVGAGVEVRLLDGEPARIVEAWTGRDLVVLVDAVCRGEAPGSLVRLEIAEDSVFAPARTPSTHAGGVDDAIALGRVLQRLPGRLIIVGVEPGDMSVGAGLSPAVAEAVPQLEESVLAELHEVRA